MTKSIAGKNIVLVGIFQPSLYDKFFFIKNEVFSEEEIQASSIFSPEMVQVSTKDSAMVIFINQIFITQVDLNNDRIKQVLEIFINAANPRATALGINFFWNIFPDQSLEEYSKTLFFNDKNQLFNKFFNTPDALYGAYVSKDIHNSRLKLDIKPQILKQIDGKVINAFVNFAFNFHYDTDSKDGNLSIVEAIKNYDDLLIETEKMVSIYD